MKKKKEILKVLVIILIVITASSLVIKGLISTKHGNLNIVVAMLLKAENYLDPIPVDGKSAIEIRNSLNKNTMRLSAKPTPISSIKNINIPTSSNQVTVRIYTPTNGSKLPIIIYSHGGAWISGNLDTHDNICRKLSKKAQAIVVSVDYRLAPENPYPEGLNDVYDVLQWIYKNAEAIHGDQKYICVAGDSAGGNLSAVVCQMARDKKGPPITCQVLIYPSTNI